LFLFTVSHGYGYGHASFFFFRYGNFMEVKEKAIRHYEESGGGDGASTA
jgi:hypothetical protein